MPGIFAVGAALLQLGILVLLVDAIRRRHVPAAFNATLALLVALVPAIGTAVGNWTGLGGWAYGPALPLWLALAGFLHSLGMLGPYDDFWWWDHLTHTVSAGLLAALVYAGLLVAAGHPSGAWIPAGWVWLVTIGIVFLVGVLWEVFELAARVVAERLGYEPFLVNYGRYDTLFDLGFDLLGAIIVVVLDIRVFVEILAPYPEFSGSLVLGFGGVSIVGSVVLGLVVAWDDSDWTPIPKL